MTITVQAPAGSRARPEPSGASDWVERGLEQAERMVDLTLTADQDALQALGVSRAKVIAETAILLRILRPWHRSARLLRLADRLSDEAVDRRTLTALALHASASFELAVPYLVLREHRADPALDVLLRRAFAAAAGQGRELLPHRRLERLWLLDLLGDATACTLPEIARTVLADELDLLHGTRDDHYAFTHALFYATDFGRSPQRVPAQWGQRLLAQARSALAGALDEDDYDLAGELLMAWPLLAVDAGPEESAALAVLRDVAAQVGTLPSLTLAQPVTVPGVPARDAALAQTYHTGFVFTALMALAPRVTWGAKAVGDSLLQRWPCGGRRPLWLETASAGLPAGALALEAELRRAARAGRVDRVAELLSRPGVPSTPATRQGLELLERVALLARVG